MVRIDKGTDGAGLTILRSDDKTHNSASVYVTVEEAEALQKQLPQAIGEVRLVAKQNREKRITELESELKRLKSHP